MQRRHPDATNRVLNLQLKELQEHGVVTKVIYPVLPPRVEYNLTDLGRSLLPLISGLEDWGSQYMPVFNELQEGKRHLAHQQII